MFSAVVGGGVDEGRSILHPLRPTNPDPEGIPRMSEKQGIAKENQHFGDFRGPPEIVPPLHTSPSFLDLLIL